MRVLLLDTAFGAVPIHDYLVDIGCEVWTIGNRAHDALALACPARWIDADYSDVGRVRALVEERNFDALIPGCTDVSMSTFAQLDMRRYYDHQPKVDRVINEKLQFRQLCQALDLPAPRAVAADALPTHGRFICKPADSFSGRGVTVFDAADATATARAIASARDNSPTAQVVCEDFVDGQLFSYSAFVEDGSVDAAFVVREGSRHDPFAVDTSYVVEDYGDEKMSRLRSAVGSIARHLGLCDGLVHVQFIDDGDKIAIIEITRRCPGDLYGRLIELSLGVPYAARYASYFVGRRVSGGSPKTRRYILRHTIKQTVTDHFRGLSMDLERAPFLVLPITRLGEPTARPKLSRTGIAFVEAATATDLERCYDQILATRSDGGQNVRNELGL